MNYQLHESLFETAPVYTLSAPVDESWIETMSAQEADSVASVVAKRRREFATARGLVREGLRVHFGIEDHDLLNGADRAPIWPAGVVGSISHSCATAWVALMDSHLGSIGIDAENRVGLEQKLWHLILREEERGFIESLPPALRERMALVIFSAKEAFYKAQYPLSKTRIGFHAVSVQPAADGSLNFTFCKDVPPFGNRQQVAGRWQEGAEILTTATIIR